MEPGKTSEAKSKFQGLMCTSLPQEHELCPGSPRAYLFVCLIFVFAFCFFYDSVNFSVLVDQWSLHAKKLK